MNRLTEEEQNELNEYACKIAKVFDDYWSIDFCRGKDGKWWCIDLATGDRSWHPECLNAPKKEDEK